MTSTLSHCSNYALTVESRLNSDLLRPFSSSVHCSVMLWEPWTLAAMLTNARQAYTVHKIERMKDLLPFISFQLRESVMLQGTPPPILI